MLIFITYSDAMLSGFTYQQTTFKSTENKIRRLDSSVISNRKMSLDSLNGE